MRQSIKTTYIHLVLLLVGTMLSVSVTLAAETTKIYELRTYTINPGKLPNALARLNLAKPLFIKYGMTVVAYWTLLDKADKNTVIYLLGHDNKEAARLSWRGFHNDPEWHKLYSESTANGSLLGGIDSKFMMPTKFSPLR